MIVSFVLASSVIDLMYSKQLSIIRPIVAKELYGTEHCMLPASFYSIAANCSCKQNSAF